MTLDETCWKAATRPDVILATVEARLVDAGALTELRQFHGLSASEMDILLWLEVHEPFASCAPSDPHAASRTMAA